MKKLIVIAIIGLFLGVSLASSINAYDIDKDNSRVQLLGMGGRYPDSTLLSDEQQKSLDIIFSQLDDKLQSAESKSVIKKGYHDCFESLRNAGIITISQQKLMQFLISIPSNKLLTVSGEITQSQLVHSSYYAITILLIAYEYKGFFRKLIPLKFGWHIGIGWRYWNPDPYYYYNVYHPASGWFQISSSRIEGDSIYGSLAENICPGHPSGGPIHENCIGVKDFTGLYFGMPWMDNEPSKFIGICSDAQFSNEFPF